MKMSGGPASVNIKLILLSIAILITAGTFYYTQSLVKALEQRETRVAELYAKSLEFVARSSEISSDFTFVFDNIIKRIDFPLILTDEKDEINLSTTSSSIRNLSIDTTLSENEIKNFIKEKIAEFKLEHEPIEVNTPYLHQRIYYGNSGIVQRLKFYPYLQIIFAFFFLVIAYTSFNYLKKSEQSNIWVGMSKETAHQLGTPISSLMGWNEILKMNYNNPDKVLDVSEEVTSDLSRLTKIAHRFSKIGSKPELKEENINEVIERVVKYFQRRIPQTGKNVSLVFTNDESIGVKLNPELFEWVLENLIKNALDAIEHKDGKIKIETFDIGKSVEIEVSDNGKGIDHKRRKDIFRPGYSTKRRGWGLGLSLSKRIVEDYHRGKIFVKNSVIKEGTTFKIILPKTDKPEAQKEPIV